jgi:hypothetical protein
LDNYWCFEFVDVPAVYEDILEDIAHEEVWLVSDGSYQPSLKFGTAAWILEGTKSMKRITGKVITPGQASDQSAYRSELAGILSAILVINKLATHHRLQFTMTIHCDCLSGLDKASQLHKPAKIRDSNYDLLHAIDHAIKTSPITWRGKYIQGHQDDHCDFQLLDRPSQLNIEVDHIAKDFMNIAIELPRANKVVSHAWSVSHGHNQLLKDWDNSIYNIVHTPKAKDYWIKKDRITEANFTSINWLRLGQALEKMPLSRRLFVSKHTSCMCGVGKFQKIWKLKETNACPHCGQYEDLIHVWKCKAEAVKDVWEHSLANLRTSLRKLDTEPDLINLIINYLDSWRNDHNLQLLSTSKYRQLLEMQDAIGA